LNTLFDDSDSPSLLVLPEPAENHSYEAPLEEGKQHYGDQPITLNGDSKERPVGSDVVER
jgi:hypothetical protein